MTIPVVSGPGSPYDVVYQIGTDTTRRMGFILLHAPSERRVSDFAPRIRQGSDPGFAETVYDQFVFHSFENGSDQEIWGDDNRHWDSDGRVALYRADRITLASQWSEVVGASGDCTYRRILEFSTSTTDFIILVMSTKLRVYDGSTWSDQAPTGGFAASPTHAYASDKYVFVALGASADAQRWDGTNWSTLSGIKADCFGWWNDKLYRALGNTLYKSSDNDGTSWSTTTYTVGWDTTSITDLYVANGRLIIAKPEGLFLFNGTEVKQVIDATKTRDKNNFAFGMEIDGFFYFPWLYTIRKAQLTSDTTGTFEDITPIIKGKDETKYIWGHGMPYLALQTPRWPVVVFTPPVGVTLSPQIMFYNGLGWHKLYEGEAGAQVGACGYIRSSNWLLINVGGKTYRKRLSNISHSEYPDYAPTGQFITPRVTGGYPDTLKSFSQLGIETEGCDDQNKVQIEYSTDAGTTWTTVGTVANNGKQRLVLAEGAQISAFDLMLRFTLIRGNDETKTPIIVLPIVLHMLVTPIAQHVYTDVLLIKEAEPLRSNWPGTLSDQASAKEMYEFLHEVEDAPETIRRFDQWGRMVLVKCTDLAVEDNIFGGDWRTEGYSAAITFIDAFAGIRKQFNGAAIITGGQATIQDTPSAQYGVTRYGLMRH